MFTTYKNTFQALVHTPRDVIDGFIHGRGAQFTHPFRFLVTGAVLCLLLNTLLVDFSFEPQPADIIADAENEHVLEIAEWIQVSNVRSSTQFLPLGMALLFVPMLALGGLIFLRNNLEGFYSNLILNSYAVGVSMLPLLAMIPVWLFLGYPLTDPFVNSTIPAVLVAGVIIWIYKLYLNPAGLMDWIRLISAYATGYILYVILNGFAAGVIGYTGFVVNRIMELSGA
jgi:hypothetical protein